MAPQPPSPGGTVQASVVRSGVFVTISGQAVRFALQFGSLAVLGRLLPVEDFGKVAMVGAIIGLAAVVSDLGFTYTAVAAKNLTAHQRSNLFWVNTGIGLVICAATALLAGALADFYGDPDVVPIAVALAGTFLLNGMGAQFKVELNRDLAFRYLAGTDVAAQAAGLVAGIVVAVVRGDFWALVAQQIAIAVTTLVLLVARTSWRPGRPRRHQDMSRLVRSGLSMSGTQFLNYIATNTDSVAIGRALGAAEVGIYNRAYQLFTLPMQQLVQPLTRVVLPTLSRVEDRAEFQRHVERCQTALAYGLLGVICVTAGSAEPLMTVVLGAKWAEGALVLQILCLGGAFQALGYVYFWVCVTTDRMHLLFLLELLGRCTTIAAVVLVAARGKESVALAVAAGHVINWALVGFIGMPRAGVVLRRVLLVSVPPVLVYAVAYAAMNLVQRVEAFPSWPALVQLLVCCATGGLVVAAGLLLPPFRRGLRVVVSDLTGRGGPAAEVPGPVAAAVATSSPVPAVPGPAAADPAAPGPAAAPRP